MATPIGDAVVKVKIDTTEAEAQLDRLDGRRQGGSEDRTRPRDRDRRPDEREGRQRPRTGQATARIRDIRRPGALPIIGGILAGGVLAAEYGPALNTFIETITNRVLDDLPLSDAFKAAVKIPLAAQSKVINATAENIAKLEAIVTAAFGGVQDVTQLARTAFIFNGTVNPEDLLEFLTGQFNIRRAQGIGRWAQRQVTRKAIGGGLGNAIADLIKTQE